jgi:hypothetical protein
LRSEQQLHSEADAKERPILLDNGLNRLDQAQFVETIHCGARCADARENDPVRASYCVRVRDDSNRGAGELERAAN